jgi:hypothetical protein
VSRRRDARIGSAAIDRLLVRLVLRACAWAGLGLITGDACLELWRRGDHWWAVAAAVFSPATLLVWPWAHSAWSVPLWQVLLAAAVASGLAVEPAGNTGFPRDADPMDRRARR